MYRSSWETCSPERRTTTSTLWWPWKGIQLSEISAWLVWCHCLYNHCFCMLQGRLCSRFLCRTEHRKARGHHHSSCIMKPLIRSAVLTTHQHKLSVQCFVLLFFLSCFSDSINIVKYTLCVQMMSNLRVTPSSPLSPLMSLHPWYVYRCSCLYYCEVIPSQHSYFVKDGEFWPSPATSNSFTVYMVHDDFRLKSAVYCNSSYCTLSRSISSVEMTNIASMFLEMFYMVLLYLNIICVLQESVITCITLIPSCPCSTRVCPHAI